MFFNKEEIDHYIVVLRKIKIILLELNIKLTLKKEKLKEYQSKLENTHRIRKILEKITSKHYSKNTRCFNLEQVA